MVYIMHIKVRGARVFNEGYRNGVETKPGAVFRLHLALLRTTNNIFHQEIRNWSDRWELIPTGSMNLISPPSESYALLLSLTIQPLSHKILKNNKKTTCR